MNSRTISAQNRRHYRGRLRLLRAPPLQLAQSTMDPRNVGRFGLALASHQKGRSTGVSNRQDLWGQFRTADGRIRHWQYCVLGTELFSSNFVGNFKTKNYRCRL